MDFPLSSFRYPPFVTTAHAARSHERRDVPWLNVCAAALLLAAVAVLLSEHSPSASAWRVRTTESLVAAYQTLVVGPRDGTKSIVHKTVDLSSLTEGDYVVITRDDCPACQILKGELSKSKGDLAQGIYLMDVQEARERHPSFVFQYVPAVFCMNKDGTFRHEPDRQEVLRAAKVA